MTHQGAYAEYFRVPARQLFLLPDEIAFPDGAIIADAVVTAVHGVERGRIADGETVMVIGIGGCGGAAVQVCKRCGATVIAVDANASKRNWALDLGADEFVDAGTVPPPELQDRLRSLHAQCVVDTVGQATTLDLATGALGRGGGW